MAIFSTKKNAFLFLTAVGLIISGGFVFASIDNGVINDAYKYAWCFSTFTAI